MYPYSIIFLVFLSLFVFWLIFYGVIIYKTPLNPLSFYLAFDSGLRVILSCALIYYFGYTDFSDGDIVNALALHFLYVSCFALPFLLRPRWLLQLVNFLVRLFLLRLPREKTRFSVIVFFILISFILINFYFLATVGDGGMLWLLDPREAYQYKKLGAGNYYLFWVWGISFLLLYVLYTIRPRTKKEFLKISPILLLILFSTYFTGSKQVLIVNILLIIFYYTNYVKAISLKFFVILGSCLLLGFLSLQLLQGTTTDLSGALAYFDYFQKTIEFVSKYDQIGPKYGEAFLSSFWGYIPRSFAPDKPLVYGQILIQEFLYPGAADAGYYPAFSSWSFLYLDFWIFGVAVSGLFSGALSWTLYELFRKNKDDIFLFSLAVQATITLYMVPLHGELYLLGWFILQRIILNFGFKRMK